MRCPTCSQPVDHCPDCGQEAPPPPEVSPWERLFLAVAFLVIMGCALHVIPI